MLSDKKLEKIERALDKDTIEEINASDQTGIDAIIRSATIAIQAAQEELEANPKYQELKESLKACSEGLREVKKRQNAKIQYAAHILDSRGEA